LSMAKVRGPLGHVSCASETCIVIQTLVQAGACILQARHVCPLVLVAANTSCMAERCSLSHYRRHTTSQGSTPEPRRRLGLSTACSGRFPTSLLSAFRYRSIILSSCRSHDDPFCGKSLVFLTAACCFLPRCRLIPSYCYSCLFNTFHYSCTPSATHTDQDAVAATMLDTRDRPAGICCTAGGRGIASQNALQLYSIDAALCVDSLVSSWCCTCHVIRNSIWPSWFSAHWVASTRAYPLDTATVQMKQLSNEFHPFAVLLQPGFEHARC
jgi:hypothetical protein